MPAGNFPSFMAEGTQLGRRGEYDKALACFNNVRGPGRGGGRRGAARGGPEVAGGTRRWRPGWAVGGWRGTRFARGQLEG